MILAKEGALRDFSVAVTTNGRDVNSECNEIISWDWRITLLLSADIRFPAMIAVDVSAGS